CQRKISDRPNSRKMTLNRYSSAYLHLSPDSPELGIVPQGMRRDWFANTATPTRLLARLLYGGLADMVIGLIAREEPPLGSIHSPPVAQDLQQLWRKHDIAIYAPLCVGKIYLAMVSQLPAINASS